MLDLSSPAKAILFGEHAVVYGSGAIAISLELRMRMRIAEAAETSVNGGSVAHPRHRYIRWAMENLWSGAGLDIRTTSEIPPASGLGSSAALSCCIAAGLRSFKERPDEREIAREAFEVEFNTQGGASPTDTSCSAHGKAILVSSAAKEGLLWTLGKNDRVWNIHHLDVPRLNLVVGYTRKPSVTPLQVQKVRKYYERSGFARDQIDEIASIVEEGISALSKGDVVRLGELMDRNHSCLSILGVNSKELQRLKDASDALSYGCKLTGAGGGGSVIALTDRPDEVCEAIRSRGGIPYPVTVAMEGTTVHDSSSGAGG